MIYKHTEFKIRQNVHVHVFFPLDFLFLNDNFGQEQISQLCIKESLELNFTRHPVQHSIFRGMMFARRVAGLARDAMDMFFFINSFFGLRCKDLCLFIRYINMFKDSSKKNINKNFYTIFLTFPCNLFYDRFMCIHKN